MSFFHNYRSTVAQSCPILCNSMECNTPGFPVFHHLSELAQTLVYSVSDAIQPLHPLSSPPVFYLSQHQGLFQWAGSSYQVAKVLKLQFQHQSSQWIFMVDFLHDWLIWSPCNPRDSQDSSPTPQLKASILQHLAFFMTTLTSIYDYRKDHSFDYMDLYQPSNASAF